MAVNRMGRDQLEFGLKVLARERPLGATTNAPPGLPGEPARRPPGGAARDQRADGTPTDVSLAGSGEPLGDVPGWPLRHLWGPAGAHVQQAGGGALRAQNNQAAAPVARPKASWSQLKQQGEQQADQQQQQQLKLERLRQQKQTNWIKGAATLQVVIVIACVLMGAVILAFLTVCIIIYRIKPSAARTGEPSAASAPSSAGAPPFESANFLFPLEPSAELERQQQQTRPTGHLVANPMFAFQEAPPAGVAHNMAHYDYSLTLKPSPGPLLQNQQQQQQQQPMAMVQMMNAFDQRHLLTAPGQRPHSITAAPGGSDYSASNLAPAQLNASPSSSPSGPSSSSLGSSAAQNGRLASGHV